MTTPTQTPSLGRVVFYHDPIVGDRAAIITKVVDRVQCNLTVFYDIEDSEAGLTPAKALVPYAEDGSPNTWSYPPRV